MCDSGLPKRFHAHLIATSIVAIGLQDDVPQVELNSEDLPPIRFADKLSVADEAAPALPPPWSTNSELLAQLQPLVLDSGLVPADEMSLLQLRRLATQARAVLLIAALAGLLRVYAAPKPDEDSCTALVRDALVAEFAALCKREVQRHEQLFVFVRRVEELEQLERGYRLYVISL